MGNDNNTYLRVFKLHELIYVMCSVLLYGRHWICHFYNLCYLKGNMSKMKYNLRAPYYMIIAFSQ